MKSLTGGKSDWLIEVNRARMQAWMLGEIEMVDLDDLRRDVIIHFVSERTQKIADEYCRVPRQRVRRILTSNGVVLFDADAGGFLNPLSSDRDLLTAEQRDFLDQRLHQHEQSDLSAGAAIEALRQIMKDAPDANVRIVVSVVGHVPIPKCSGETLPRGAMTVKHTRPLHSQAENIIGKFGGIRATARMAGFPVTTVQRWKESGRINPDYNDRILEAAAANGIVLTVEDVSTVDPSHPLLGAPVADPAEPVEVGVP